jgi:hypothetical protein
VTLGQKKDPGKKKELLCYKDFFFTLGNPCIKMCIEIKCLRIIGSHVNICIEMKYIVRYYNSIKYGLIVGSKHQLKISRELKSMTDKQADQWNVPINISLTLSTLNI